VAVWNRGGVLGWVRILDGWAAFIGEEPIAGKANDEIVHLGLVERFGEIGVSPGSVSIFDCLHAVELTDDDPKHLAKERTILDPLQNLDPINAREIQVEKEDRGNLGRICFGALKISNGIGSIGDAVNGIGDSSEPQGALNEGGIAIGIFNEEDSIHNESCTVCSRNRARDGSCRGEKRPGALRKNAPGRRVAETLADTFNVRRLLQSMIEYGKRT
jgi:hypothetical protein